jgi:hypothetical protein
VVVVVGAERVIVDGAEVPFHDGARLRVDPGVHVVAIPNGPSFTVSIGERKTRTLEIPRPAPRPSAPAAALSGGPSTTYVRETHVAPFVAIGLAIVGYGVAAWGMVRMGNVPDDSAGPWALGIGGALAIGGTLGSIVLPWSTVRPRGPNE